MRKSFQDEVRNEVSKEALEIEKTIKDRIGLDKKKETDSLWYGHVCLMEKHRPPLQAEQWSPAGCWRRGRPRRIWSEDITELLTERGLSEEDIESRERCQLVEESIKGKDLEQEEDGLRYISFLPKLFIDNLCD